jgi:hypothetical protein
MRDRAEKREEDQPDDRGDNLDEQPGNLEEHAAPSDHRENAGVGRSIVESLYEIDPKTVRERDPAIPALLEDIDAGIQDILSRWRAVCGTDLCDRHQMTITGEGIGNVLNIFHHLRQRRGSQIALFSIVEHIGVNLVEDPVDIMLVDAERHEYFDEKEFPDLKGISEAVQQMNRMTDIDGKSFRMQKTPDFLTIAFHLTLTSTGPGLDFSAHLHPEGFDCYQAYLKGNPWKEPFSVDISPHDRTGLYYNRPLTLQDAVFIEKCFKRLHPLALQMIEKLV